MNPKTNTGRVLRSQAWFGPRNLEGFLHRAGLKSQGWSEESFADKPVVGIANSWSEATHCNAHLRTVAEHVKRGVIAAGGFPIEFPTISLGEFFLNPTSMLYRNLMAMDVEEMIRGLPIDAVVLLAGCDKTTPAMLMGAASADLPALIVTGGPQLKGNWRNEELGSCTDCRRYWTELRAGNITQADYDSMEESIYRSAGHCMVMGTASTMAVMCEALGMALPGTAAIPGADARRMRSAEQAGRTAVKLIGHEVRPSQIMTESAFRNAAITLLALGGSTNAIIHLTAIAGRCGIDLPPSIWNELSARTPVIANLKPSGEYLMEDFFYAGGAPAFFKKIAPLLEHASPNVSDATMGEIIDDAECYNDDVIRDLEDALHPTGGITVLRGTLAPDTAVIKTSAASPGLLQYVGRAVVFESPEDLEHRIDDPDLDVNPDDVLVMRSAGPVGGPGMPEAGFLPLPKKLLAQGVRDMVRISDARMSGTAFGTIVLHVSPESAIGGPLALVRNGDQIRLDATKGTLDLLVNGDDLNRRRADSSANGNSTSHDDRGYAHLYNRHVMQAQHGCDFDFAVGKSPVNTRVRMG